MGYITRLSRETSVTRENDIFKKEIGYRSFINLLSHLEGHDNLTIHCNAIEVILYNTVINAKSSHLYEVLNYVVCPK